MHNYDLFHLPWSVKLIERSFAPFSFSDSSAPRHSPFVPTFLPQFWVRGFRLGYVSFIQIFWVDVILLLKFKYWACRKILSGEEWKIESSQVFSNDNSGVPLFSGAHAHEQTWQIDWLISFHLCPNIDWLVTESADELFTSKLSFTLHGLSLYL